MGRWVKGDKKGAVIFKYWLYTRLFQGQAVQISRAYTCTYRQCMLFRMKVLSDLLYDQIKESK